MRLGASSSSRGRRPAQKEEQEEEEEEEDQDEGDKGGDDDDEDEDDGGDDLVKVSQDELDRMLFGGKDFTKPQPGESAKRGVWDTLVTPPNRVQVTYRILLKV